MNENEIIEVDIVCVGAGIATLSTIIQLLKHHQEQSPNQEPPSVLILEKGPFVGAHILSGAVMNPEPLSRLLSKEQFDQLPFDSTVEKESFYFLTPAKSLRLPITPPPMKAKGYPIVSLSKLTRYLGEFCESMGAEIYTETPVVKLLENENGVVGIRTGDAGLNKDKEQKPGFEAGMNIHARVVVLGEGACGILTEQLITNKQLQAPNPQAYALGLKEIIEIPETPGNQGSIFHTFGYPLDSHTYGGGFVYGLDSTHVALGLVIALDYRDPELNPHTQYNRFKAHPLVMNHIRGGKVVAYGAKILPEGGFYALPTPVANGVMIVGDGAGLLDSVQLKGIHLAIESGMAAGSTLYDAFIQNNYTMEQLQTYPKHLEQSPHWKRLKQYRHVRPAFKYGLLPGIIATGLSFLLKGWLPLKRMALHQDHKTIKPADRRQKTTGEAHPQTDKQLFPDLLTDVYYSGTKHEEDHPCHLIITNPETCLECFKTYGAPCTRFCPASVYEKNESKSAITIQPSNCLHCKTCKIKCPYQLIEWQLPEGGGGPQYRDM